MSMQNIYSKKWSAYLRNAFTSHIISYATVCKRSHATQIRYWDFNNIPLLLCI